MQENLTFVKIHVELITYSLIYLFKEDSLIGVPTAQTLSLLFFSLVTAALFLGCEQL